ncbi:Microcystin-dependent protein [Algoriphagus locisalis]|uniref:Microcystin-dependent protein n=1 Tax=Algoriphagus locisalis TaxID=305507 RepID=A0A1I7EAF1_9BACT|nr:tail fiber protein [Algoriphagus locisalis]SFU20889.1 Microcystin-dependent protein [Algoriphagus locisalis]
MDEYIGIVKMFAGTFAPRGWAFCNGQLLAISSNSALFSILGTTYGGDGRTTFALPNLMGRVPLGTGQGPGLSSHRLGDMAGQENVTLNQTEIPQHTHSLQASSGVGSVNTATNNFPAGGQIQIDRSSPVYPTNCYATSGGTAMNPQAIGVAGGSQPHSNMQPYLAMNYIICLQGIFPPRD